MFDNFKKHSITLFCRYLDVDRNEAFTKTTIHNVMCDESKTSYLGDKGVFEVGNITIYIMNDSQSSSPYVKPKEFEKKPNESYTLKAGDKIVIGVVEDTGKSFSIKELERKYDDVYTVASVSTLNFGEMSHFEVVCK